MNTPDRFTSYALQTAAGAEVNNVPMQVRSSYYHMRNGKCVGVLHLTDERALDLLTHGWNLRPCNRAELMERLANDAR